jgi:peptide/nickel transport system ATP-binding protein
MPPEPTALLEADNVTVRFGGGLGRPVTTALSGVTLKLAASAPEIVAVVGESGSGKTTLTRLLLGLLPPGQGTVRYDGQDVATLAGTARSDFRRNVQAIFQDPFGAYNPFYRVDRTLTVPAVRFGLAATRAEARALIEQSLAEAGLRPQDTLGRYPHQLSGGQRQRLMVARALMLRPRVLVADEPVSMVDASLRATILQSLYRLRIEHGISILYVTHDLTTAYQVADRILVMQHGRVVEEGTAEAIIHTPRHPYTAALVAAVPPPDPTVTGWLEQAE